MKKVFILILIAMFAITGCSGSAPTVATPISDKALEKQDFDKLFTDAESYKGYKVDFYGKVFRSDVNDGIVYLQAYTNIKKSDKVVMIKVTDPQYKTTDKEYVHVIGTVHGVIEGTNAFGVKLTIPATIADTIEKVGYIEAVSPSLKTIEVNQEQNQNGYVMKIGKIELAADETRVYMTIRNETSGKITYYEHNTNLIQGNKQLEHQLNFNAGYPEIQNEILPGIITEGIVPFPAVDIDAGSLKIVIEASWDMDLFEFDITW